jgi:hypothetical protein
VLARAAERGDKPALIDAPSGRAITYQQLAAAVRAGRPGLAERGFGQGEVFARYAPNLPEHAVAFLAVASVGGVKSTANGVDLWPPRDAQREPTVNQARRNGETTRAVTSDGTLRSGPVPTHSPITSLSPRSSTWARSPLSIRTMSRPSRISAPSAAASTGGSKVHGPRGKLEPGSDRRACRSLAFRLGNQAAQVGLLLIQQRFDADVGPESPTTAEPRRRRTRGRPRRSQYLEAWPPINLRRHMTVSSSVAALLSWHATSATSKV